MSNQFVSAKWTATRDELRTRRAARAARRTLERDLANYNTPAQLSELNAIVSRYDGPDAARIQEIVFRHRFVA